MKRRGVDLGRRVEGAQKWQEGKAQLMLPAVMVRGGAQAELSLPLSLSMPSLPLYFGHESFWTFAFY